MADEKISAVKLIRDFFEIKTPKEIMDCTSEDRTQLASAIARQKGLTAEQLSFVPVAY